MWEELLCLLPFEEAYFARHGLQARFVGHPVLQSGADQGSAARFRARHGLAADAPVLVLMPGSRRSEAPRLLPRVRPHPGAAEGRAAEHRPRRAVARPWRTW